MERQTKGRRPTPSADCLVQTPGLMTISADLILLFSILAVSLALPNSVLENLEPLENVVNSIELSKRPEDTCYTAGCNYTAAVIIQNMNTSVDPCENFYEYTCGRYGRKNHVRNELRENMKTQIREIIEAEIQPNESKVFKMVKTYYKSCMNLRAIEDRGLQPLLGDIRKMGGWPVLDGDAWNETAFDREETILKYLDNGYRFDYIMRLQISMGGNFGRHVISIRTGSLELPIDFHRTELAETNTSLYHEQMVDIATVLGAERNRSIKELRDSVNFEVELRQIIEASSSSDGTSIRNVVMTVQDLLANYSYIPWNEYFRRLSAPTITINLNDLVYLREAVYYDRLNDLLLRTSKRVQANYLMSRLAYDSIQYVSTGTQRMKERAGVPNENYEAASRMENCVMQAIDLKFAVDAMYVSKYANQDTIEHLTAMFRNIKSAVKTNFEAASWMDELMRRRGVAKLDAMKYSIPEIDNRAVDNVLEAIYGNIEMSEHNYYENRLKVEYMKRVFWNCEIYKEAYNVSCFEHRQKVRGSYILSSNTVALGIGLLQDVFYSSDRPRYLNYGGLGCIIGHEITHGLGFSGLHFDENGTTSELPQDSHEAFLNRAECIRDQYSGYTVTQIGKNFQINGGQTLEENFADNEGIRATYRAYNDWAVMNEEEPNLPGINMTAKQLFWISMATTYCTPNDVYTGIIPFKLGKHSPAWIRVIGTLVNMREFANDFSCPVGSKMNPENKCSVW